MAAIIEQHETIFGHQVLVVHQVAQDVLVLMVGINVHQVEFLDTGSGLNVGNGVDGFGANDGHIFLVGELAQAFLIQVVPGCHVVHRPAVVVRVGIDGFYPRRQLVKRAVGVIGRRAPAVDQDHFFWVEGVVQPQCVFTAQDAELGDYRLFVVGVKNRAEKVVEGFPVGHADFHTCSFCCVVGAAFP
ncbi:hypothetical protein D3C78_1218320 [compost metagenome]